ncbi:MAG: response regulator transcription factor [Methylococcales bacterium]
MRRVLLIDDDVELSDMLTQYLNQEEFTVDQVFDGEQGVEQAVAEGYDIVLLDVMLPGLNGFEVLPRIRQHSQVPVLMLTARGEDIDRVIGLEMGADDYLPKPCNPRELVARIRAILRRTEQMSDSRENTNLKQAITLGDLYIQPALRRVLFKEEVLDITSTEFNILLLLVNNAGQVVSKEDLSQQALGRELARYDRSIDMHVSNLRRKFGDSESEHPLIHTIRGIGYQFVKGDP